MKLNKWQIWLFLACFLTSSIYLGVYTRNCAKFQNELKNAQKEVSVLKDSISSIMEFSPNNVITFLEVYQVKYPDTVFKQILLETNRFQSDLFKANNNLFGMKHPQQRPTTSIMDSQGYALYSNYIASIRDYKIFQDRYYKGGDYLQFLARHGYASDSLYSRKINNIRHDYR